MDKEILAELHKVEQELAKLSKLKPTKTTKQRKLKLTRRRAALQSQVNKPKETTPAPIEKAKPKKAPEAKEEPKKAKKPKEITTAPPIEFKSKKTPEVKKAKSKTKKQRKKEKQEKISVKKDKKRTKKKETPVQETKAKAIPFGTIPEKVITPSEPMSFIGMVVTGIIDRIEQALDGRSELVEIHTGTSNHIDTAEYNGTYISARSYYHRLDVAARSTVLVKICNEAMNEVKLINANDKSALAAYEEGKLISNILVEKQDEILARLFAWVFDSDQSEEALSSVDALFPFTEAFGGTRYQQELASDLDKAANEDISGGIEREEYDPKNTFTGYLTGREFVILPDDTIQAINDSNIKFEKGSDGKYLIGGKSYTLKEAIERL